MKQLLQHKLILKEAAVVEQLRRSDKVKLHPSLVNGPLIYDKETSEVLRALYQSYINVAQSANTPFLMCTPTWRCNKERLENCDAPMDINQDAVRFLKSIRSAQKGNQENIKIGGLIGCKNDCYKPEEGLSLEKAKAFHAWQINELASAGVDFLVCETIPNVEEAKGIALAMEATGLPYLISFVINRHGYILDGTNLNDAVKAIDELTQTNPLGYQINCAYPSFLHPEQQSPELFSRLIGYQGNGSSLDHCDLDGADELQAESVKEWGDAMLNLNQKYGVKILGGCCGTGVEHLEYLVGK